MTKTIHGFMAIPRKSKKVARYLQKGGFLGKEVVGIIFNILRVFRGTKTEDDLVGFDPQGLLQICPPKKSATDGTYIWI